MDAPNQFNRSYFVRFGEDRNRSYFTYYSEFNRSNPNMVYVEIFFLCLLTVISTVGNAVILFVVFSNRKMQTITNLFIANMCIADILFTLPNPVIGYVRYQENWTLSETSCGFLIYIQIVCGVVSIWSMTLISMDRHRIICKLIKSYYKWMNEFTARIAIAVAWFVALGLSIPIILYFKVEQFDFAGETVKVCTLMWPKGGLVRLSAVFVFFSCVLGFAVPLCIIMYNYISIFRTLWRTRRNMLRQKAENARKSSSNDVANGKLNERQRTNMASSRNRRDFRVVRMLVLTVCIFGLMWLPMCVVFICILHDGVTEAMRTSSASFLLATCIAFANACVNPFIYGIFSEKFRAGIKRAFKCVPGLNKGDASSKMSIRTISGLPNEDRTESPSTSSDRWRNSANSLAIEDSPKTTDVKIQLDDIDVIVVNR